MGCSWSYSLSDLTKEGTRALGHEAGEEIFRAGASLSWETRRSHRPREIGEQQGASFWGRLLLPVAERGATCTPCQSQKKQRQRADPRSLESSRLRGLIVVCEQISFNPRKQSTASALAWNFHEKFLKSTLKSTDT